MRSFVLIFFVDEEPTGDSISCFVLLLLALETVPLFRQVLFVNAVHMEPLPLAVRVLTHDHFAEWSPGTVTISGLLLVVGELSVLNIVHSISIGQIVVTDFGVEGRVGVGESVAVEKFVEGFAPGVKEEFFFFGFLFLFVFKLIIELLIKLRDDDFELLWDVVLLFVVAVELFLFGDYFLILTAQRYRQLDCLGLLLLFRPVRWTVQRLLVLFELGQEPPLQRAQRLLDRLGPFVQISDQPQVPVYVVRHQVHFVYKLVQVSSVSRHLSKLFRICPNKVIVI